MDANEVRTRLQDILNNAGHDFNNLAALVQQLHNNIQSHLNNPQSAGQTTTAAED